MRTIQIEGGELSRDDAKWRAFEKQRLDATYEFQEAADQLFMTCKRQLGVDYLHYVIDVCNSLGVTAYAEQAKEIGIRINTFIEENYKRNGDEPDRFTIQSFFEFSILEQVLQVKLEDYVEED